ncbi:hypothetical protein MY3296_002319 [Beauveria thailandica]
MPGPNPFPQHPIPFPGAASSSGSFQSRMPSPRSHDRELYPDNGPKGLKRRKTTHDSLVSSTPARPSAVQPEPRCIRLPQLRPENKRRPAYQAEAATYTYKFAQDLTTGDDIIERDTTVDCFGCESSEQADNAEPVPRLPWQVPGSLNRQPDFEINGRNQEKSKEFMSNDLKDRSYSYDIESRNLLSRAPNRDSSAGLFSISDHGSTTSMDTSLPPEGCEDSNWETDSVTEVRSTRRRQPSTQLGTTPNSVRHTNRALSLTPPEEQGVDNEETSVPLLRRLPTKKKLVSTENEETIVGTRQPEAEPGCQPWSSHQSPSAEFIDSDVWPISTGEEEPDLQYSIADEILGMHQLMSKPFWANDQRWLANISCPVPQSRPATPYSSAILKDTAGLIKTIECIKAIDGEEEQARFAAAMSSRIAKFIMNMRGACTATWQHLFGNLTKPPNSPLHETAVLRMQRYVIPRLVFALGQVFTLLCNEQPEVRALVLFVLAEICIDMNQIAKTIEYGTRKGKPDSDTVAEVEETKKS